MPKEVLLINMEYRTLDLLEQGYQVTNYDDQMEVIDALKHRLTNKMKLPSVILVKLFWHEGLSFDQLAGFLEGVNQRLPIIVLDINFKRSRLAELKSYGIADYLKIDVSSSLLAKQIERVCLTPSNNYKEQDPNIPIGIPMSKRVFDIIVASLLLLILSPLFFLVMLLIRLESEGPVFYWQPRVGTGYRVFKFFKFRSMVVNADQQIGTLLSKNTYDEYPTTEMKLTSGIGRRLVGDNSFISESYHLQDLKKERDQSFKKFINDPRITRVGAFIRKTSIDELPQLVNVLIGDMSIVGNRPLPLYEAEKLTEDDWAERFMGPAGITGLWQVTERGKANTSPVSRKMLDIQYARTFNFWLDLKILLKTPLAAIQQEKV